MLLWVGAILCYVAYAIEYSQNPDILGDNVSLTNQTILKSILNSFVCFPVVPRHCIDDRRRRHRMLLLLPGEQELQDYGILQELGSPIGPRHP